jgi:tRNA-modifying protein YgfZ
VGKQTEGRLVYLPDMVLDLPYPASRLHSLRHGALVVTDAPAIFRIEGSGALTCLQGLLTNDLAAAGDGSLVYGAMLTAKGMIIFDAWVLRESTGFTLVTSAGARAAAADLFRKTLPPRLARVADLTDSHRVAWFLGAAAPERLARALGASIPGHGNVLRMGPEDRWLAAGGTTAAPFSALVIAPAGEADTLSARFEKAGSAMGESRDLFAARVLAGWPTLGREIDEKTLPPEVRFDELGGVSYTKGCYTGQETVARIHFRGHVNRSLRGLVIMGQAELPDRALMVPGKDVGSLKSALHLEDRVLALAMVRREVDTGASVTVSGQNATVVSLPFELSVQATTAS